MESYAALILRILIDKCKSKNVKKGLQIALEVVQDSGHYNYLDELTEEGQWEEVKHYLK